MLLLFAVIGGILVFHSMRDEPADPRPSERRPLPASDVEPDTVPTPAPKPTSPTLVERSSDWVAVAAPSPTPTVWTATTLRPRRRQPTPTPPVSRCVAVRWSAHQSFAAWGHVLVDIHAVNQCGRKLEPHEIAVWIAGYRDGAIVQTASGTAFDVLYPGRSTNFAIGLPGSIDWYDRITVEVMD